MCYEPVKHKPIVAARARDTRKIYDQYERICVKSEMYVKDPRANYTMVRLDENTQVITEIFLPEFLRRTGLKENKLTSNETNEEIHERLKETQEEICESVENIKIFIN